MRRRDWGNGVDIVRRAVVLFFAYTAVLAGAAIVVIDLERRTADVPVRRLDPSAPLVADADSPTLNRGARLARVRIPAIGVDEVLVEGVSKKQLAVGLGRYPTSARIGEPGVLAIAGHRTGWGDPLLRLNELSTGDRIIVNTREGRFVYRVTRSVIVDPSDRWVLKGNPDSGARDQLVVTTCDPPYTAEKRLIVWADLASA